LRPGKEETGIEMGIEMEMVMETLMRRWRSRGWYALGA
jgi:hypothetical protein